MKARLKVYMGRVVPTPLSGSMMQAIESIEVRQTLNQRSTFQIVFRDALLKGSADYAVLGGDLGMGTVMPSVRTIIKASIPGTEQVLIDGYITNLEVSPSDGVRPTLITATGEDLTVRMDLVQKSTEWPCLPDAALVLAILALNADLGLLPLALQDLAMLNPYMLIPPLPTDRTPMQHGTDYQFLQGLAAKYSYVFRAVPSDVAGANYAYFGPPIQTSASFQAPLSVGYGLDVNVDTLAFNYDALRPHIVAGKVYGIGPIPIFPLLTVPSPVDPCGYAKDPPIGIQPTFFRSDFPSVPYGNDWKRALLFGELEVLESQQSVVTASGRLDVFRYGSILLPYLGVPVRGAGRSFDGNYYVTDVTHHIRQGTYTQEFRLARGGLIGWISRVSTGPSGLPSDGSDKSRDAIATAATAETTVPAGLPY